MTPTTRRRRRRKRTRSMIALHMTPIPLSSPMLAMLLLALAASISPSMSQDSDCPQGYDSVVINDSVFCDPSCTEDEIRSETSFLCEPVVCSVKYGVGYFFNLQTRLCQNISPDPDEVPEDGGELPSLDNGNSGSNVVDAILPGAQCPLGQELISLNGFNFCTPECTEDEERLSGAQCQGVDCVAKYGSGHIFNITTRLCQDSAPSGSFLDGLFPGDGNLGGLLDPVIIVDGNLTTNLFTEKSDDEIRSLTDRSNFSLSNLTLKGWIALFMVLGAVFIIIRMVVRFIRQFWPGFCQCSLLEVGRQIWRKSTKTTKPKKSKDARPNWDNCGEVIYDSRGLPPSFVRVTSSEGESDDKSIP